MMRSKSYNLNHLHEPSSTTPTRLSLLNSRPIFTPPENTPPPPPPPPQTEVSVPFMWEEAPGKPRRYDTQSKPNTARTLELPPRLLFLDKAEVPSPTTVLNGPYVGRAMSFSSSYRTPRGHWNSHFGSTRWSGSGKNGKESEGSFDFSGPITLGTPKPNRGKITGLNTRRFNLSRPKPKSQFWGNIYESFKHMVPWRSCQEKHRKWASN